MKPVNNSIYLGDLPRILHSEFKLHRMLDLHDAVGTWSGLRPDEFEIAVRLSGSAADCSQMHQENASSPRAVTPSGSETSVRLMQ